MIISLFSSIMGFGLKCTLLDFLAQDYFVSIRGHLEETIFAIFSTPIKR